MPPDIRLFLLRDHDAALGLWRSTPGVGPSEADRRGAIERFLARNQGLAFWLAAKATERTELLVFSVSTRQAAR